MVTSVVSIIQNSSGPSLADTIQIQHPFVSVLAQFSRLEPQVVGLHRAQLTLFVGATVSNRKSGIRSHRNLLKTKNRGQV